MNNQIYNNIFLYICDRDGFIKTVIHSIGKAHIYTREEKIFDYILPDCKEIWKEYTNSSYVELSDKHWKSFLSNIGDETFACYIAILDENQLMILGMKNDIQQYLYEEILIINGKLTNKMRELYKGKTISSFVAFDEISKLNSELVNSRRELKKKNRKLEELNLKLELLTIKDYLTDLYNRRYFYSFSSEVANRAKRLNCSSSIIMIDINDFKKINDIFGHNEGDKLLIYLSNCMKSTFRSGQDTIFRFGGDEFLVFLEASNHKDSLLAMDRLMKLYEKDSKGTTLAYGIVEIEHTELKDDLNEVVKIADALMYAKRKENKELFEEKTK